MNVIKTQPTLRCSGPEGFAAEIFERFPNGIIVFGPSGAPLGWNGAAADLLHDVTSDAHCCELLGCRSDEGALAGGCLTELARQSESPLPEVRIDLPGGRAAWLTAARLAGEEGLVVVEVRPGERGDRRRRTEPHWVAQPELRIHTFGRTRVESREGPIGGGWLAQRPGQILKYLVCARRSVAPTDAIAEAIWPGTTLSALGSVRYFVHALRHKIEPARAKRAPSTFVLAHHGGYMLNPKTVRIDADDFEQHARAGLAALRRGERDAAERALHAAVAIYSGEFLADEPYAQWALAERDRLRELASDALRALTVIKLETGDLGGAAEHLERLSRLLPYDVDVQRQWLALLLARGRRSDATRTYVSLRNRLRQTFGEEPDFAFADVTPDELGRL